MEKRSYAFFGRARGEKSKKRSVCGGILLLVVSLMPLHSFSARAEEASHSSKGTEKKDEEILLLPAFDVERVNPNTQVKVGDRLQLLLLNFKLPQGLQESDLLVEALPTVQLNDEGWILQSPLQKNPPGESRPSFTVVPLKSGSLDLPSLVIKEKNGKSIGRTNPFKIDVASAISANDSKPQQPEDIEPPVGLQFPWGVVVFVGLGVILLLGAALFGYYQWQKSRKPKDRKKLPEVIRSEDETALLSLIELERSGLIQRGDFKGFYFRLSEILKAYIGARYRFDAPESTTREIIAILENKKTIDDSILARLEKAFDQLDLVKFTDQLPSTDEPRNLIGEAREFVMMTRRPSVSTTLTNSSGVSGNAVR